MTQTQKKFFNSSDARSLINTYGFALFPVHGVINGRCTCGDEACANVGKHPAVGGGGFHHATKDIDKLKELWAGRQGLNVGIATGAISGCFVVDIDGAQGEADLKALGDLPATLTASTGKGRHLFFKHTGGLIKTRRGVIGEKVDVRGDGGYVVGAGSHHASGNVYEFVNPLEEIAYAPQWLIDAVQREVVPQRPQLQIVETAKPMAKALSGWSIEDANDLLSHLNPDCGYDEWVQIGMAVQSEGLPFKVWDDWSRRGTKYKNDTAQHWKSFKAGGGISFGTVVKRAQDAGWGRKSYDFKPIQQLPKVQMIETVTLDGEVIEEHPKAPIPFTLFGDIKPRIDANDFVEGLLGQGQFSVVYGESNCGKTFFMTDLAFHVALGRKWRDCRVDKGGVVYVALEGSFGLSNRIAAFRQEHPEAKDMPFAVITTQINFLDPNGNLGDFIETVKFISDQIGNVKLIVVDTLARAISGGDENSGQDMGLLVHHADQIRAATEAHVCFVHHSGKNKALGARGHSSLRAAVDTELEVSRDEGASFSTVKVVKQRDMELGDDMYFGLKSVCIGVNKYNEEVKSCVVDVVDEPEKVRVKDDVLSPAQQFVYDTILNCMARIGTQEITYAQLAQELEDSGWLSEVPPEKAKDRTKSVRESLRKKNLIGFDRGLLWLINKD
jgi:RecA-family ATPase